MRRKRKKLQGDYPIRMMTRWMLIGVALVVLAGVGEAQDFGVRLGTVQRGGKVSYEPTGPGVLFDALDPAVRKWYVPQELYAEYRWDQWEYSNYARENYQRYVSTSLEGHYFYDLYGNYLTQGWLIYDWQQVNPQPFGSSLGQSGQFGGWFNRLVVASDHKGQYHYAITVGSEIRTTLTPMTFSKPLFNGVQWDFVSDKYAATLLLSRISDPSSFLSGGEARQITDNTNMQAGRMEIQVGDFVKLGGNYVNAHHAHTRSEAFTDDVFRGSLLSAQNAAAVTAIEVLIMDDSPEDGKGGGALFASDLLVLNLEGEETRGSEIGFRALVEGGFQRRGFLSADGNEVIRLRFDFADPSYTGPDPSRIEKVTLELVVANDYRVEIASDRQLDVRGEMVFLPVARASGNVKDGSNQRVLVFDYGLPTANQIAGFTFELNDLAGFEGYAELNINHQFRQYPNPRLNQHRAASSTADAWVANLSRKAYPYFLFGEAFSMSPGYTTAMQVVSETGDIDYTAELQRYEFVEDNDDQDRRPDWKRKGWGQGDEEIFPGWDENNDFISDFNQNDNEISPNRVPDYEEPFMRFHSDRPEFLYGVDMNHNQWIDRFENDEEADYPYRRDRKGYNVYGGVFVVPDVRLTVGQERVRQIADDRRERATYLQLSADVDRVGWGRLRLFQDVRKVRDTIRDDLLQWLQPPNNRGDLFPVRDVLPAQNTWINSTWIGLERTTPAGLQLVNKLKWLLYHQRDGERELALRGAREQGSFFGVINKAEYRMSVGKLILRPGWKSEFRRETPVVAREPKRRELSELLILLSRYPIFRHSFLELGAEYLIFSQLRDPRPPGAEDSFKEIVGALQLTNLSDYMGYRLTTIVGLQVTHRDFEVEPTQTHTRGFMTVYAGVER